MRQYICIDIGGTSIKYGVIDETGRFLKTGETATEAWQGGPAVLEKAVHIAEDYLDHLDAAGICVSTAGMVDWEKGRIVHAAPLIPSYTGTEIKATLEAACQLPCEVENDVNCAGLAEDYAGAAKGTSSSLCLTVGTGIGGCAIIGHRVFHGFSNSACEIGYMHMKGSDFQTLGAASILVKNVARAKNIPTSAINGREIFHLAKAGDEDCIQAIDSMCDILGMGIANICYVLNPEIVVLGGGIMAQKEYLYAPIRAAMDRYLVPLVAANTRLAFAQNQNQAGMLGAFYHFINLHPL